jgi:hypothetical protein
VLKYVPLVMSGLLRRKTRTVFTLLALAAAFPSLIAVDSGTKIGWSFAGVIAFGGHCVFCALLFAFEPLGPSRRVRVHWDRERAGIVRRFFGPGLLKGAMLVLVLGAMGMAGIVVLDTFALHAAGTPSPKVTEQTFALAAFAGYAIPFFVFIVGFNTWLRARGSTPWVARLVNGGVLFLIAAGPWVVAAIGGVLSHGRDKEWLAIASPSPFYAFAMIAAIEDGGSEMQALVASGLACATGWGLLGFLLLGMAARKTAHVVAEHEAAVAQAEAALRAEEEALQAQAAAMPAEG